MTPAVNNALLKLVMAANHRGGKWKTFPTVLLSDDIYRQAKTVCRGRQGQKVNEAPAAEVVRIILCSLGMRAERVRMDGQGMLALFRRMMECAPWEEVTPEDSDGELSGERLKDLTPLYLLKGSENSLIRQFDEFHRKRQRQIQFLQDPLPEVLATVEGLPQTRRQDFISDLRLARALGPDTVEKLFELVFDPFDEIRAAPGVPDLFVWDSDRKPLEWFFAEVKGPRDSLQASQSAWLRQAWEDIEGRFALIVVG